MSSFDYIYVDVETGGLDARADSLELVSIDGEVFDLNWVRNPDFEADKEQVVSLLSAPKTWVLHNAQFDLDFLQEHLGLVPALPVYDTMVAYQIVKNGYRYANGAPIAASLKDTLYNLLRREMDKTYQKIDWTAPLIEDAAYTYASNDTKVLPLLREKLDGMLDGAGLRQLFDFEMMLLPVLLAMKRKGVRIDEAEATTLAAKLVAEADRITVTLPPRLNPRSSKQIVAYFPQLPDAQEDTLRDYVLNTDDPTAKKVMQVKKLLKKSSTINKQLLARVSGKDGRIHPSYTQTFTETGRLSSKEPNLQNQDRGPEVRGLFIPSEGKRFVIADYSQLELRLAARLSGDENMLSAYAAGRDLHSETCRRIFGEETKKTRTLSKNINFGLIFGGGHGTLMKFAAKNDVYISEEEAVEFKRLFHEAYPQLTNWQRRVGTEKGNFIYSMRGRRRFAEEDAYCLKINNGVQSSAADGMKRALIMLHRDDLTPVLCVHDEVVVEVDEETAERDRDTIVDRMVDAMYHCSRQDRDNPIVEIVVEAGIADDWSEK